MFCTDFKAEFKILARGANEDINRSMTETGFSKLVACAESIVEGQYSYFDVKNWKLKGKKNLSSKDCVEIADDLVSVLTFCLICINRVLVLKLPKNTLIVYFNLEVLRCETAKTDTEIKVNSSKYFYF